MDPIIDRNLRTWPSGYFMTQGEYHFPYSEYPSRLAIEQFLPWWEKFLQLWEQKFGCKWRITSWVRNSAGHKDGYAIDIVPDFHGEDLKRYSASRNSDPVWHRRPDLISYIAQVLEAMLPEWANFGLNILNVGCAVFVEPDHLHVTMMAPENITANTPTGRNTSANLRAGQIFLSLFVWGDPKHVYPDTMSRNSYFGRMYEEHDGVIDAEALHPLNSVRNSSEFIRDVRPLGTPPFHNPYEYGGHYIVKDAAPEGPL